MNLHTYGPEEALPPNIILPQQTHSNRIVEIVTGEEDLAECDGIWCYRTPLRLRGVAKGGGDRNFLLGVKTADCAPIAFWNDEIYGVLHCGWRGLCNGIVEKMLQIFCPPCEGDGSQSDPGGVHIFVGPMLHRFEIRKDFCYDQLYEVFDDQFFLDCPPLQRGERGVLTFDFRSALTSLLPESTKWDPRSTYENPGLASWRRDRDKRRNITVIGG